MKLAALLIAAVLQNTAGMKLGSLESKSVQLGDKRNQSALLGKTAVQLEPEAFALFGAKNTPELAELKKQMANSIKNEMKPALMANLQKVQAQVDAAAKAGNQCGSKALEEASEYNSKFSSAKDAHATCRGEESTLIRENKTCSTELTELTTAKETQCNAVTALEQSQSRASEACATASGESYLAQMERLRSHFDQAVTEYKNQKDLCSTATAKVGKKATECQAIETSHIEKKIACNQAQATMDSSSCAYSEAATVACKTCYTDAATSYESSKPGFASQQQSMRHEMEAILRITCYLNALDDADKSAALTTCSGQDHSTDAEVVSIALTYPNPLEASCSAPSGVAGTAEYEASVYGVLPSDAPAAACAASCCDTSPQLRKVFTSCGANGPYGPSQDDCDKAYGNSDVLVPTTDELKRGYQIFTVPETGSYVLLAAGAAGGQVSEGIPGKGAVVSGKFTLDKGTKLVMVVGQKGNDGDSCNDGGGGGGGGTTIAVLDQGTDQLTGDVPTDLRQKMVKPLLVAGGGAGNDDNAYWGCKQISAPGMDGGLTQTGGSMPAGGGSRGPCRSNGAGFKGDNTNDGHTKTFLQGSRSQKQTGWRESGGFGGGASSCNSGGAGGGYWGGRTDDEAELGNGRCSTAAQWDEDQCTSGGTSFMDSSGSKFLAHGALSHCNGYIILESCTGTCAPSKIPEATFGQGCTWSA